MLKKAYEQALINRLINHLQKSYEKSMLHFHLLNS